MIKYEIKENITIIDFKEKISANEYSKIWSIFGIPIWRKYYKNTYDIQDEQVKSKPIGLRP